MSFSEAFQLIGLGNTLRNLLKTGLTIDRVEGRS
ncbi:MAG: hypothetical protein ACI9SP_000877 [Arenicella sp.]|jgi:hypothetical protein